jgi:hypothetical protein
MGDRAAAQRRVEQVRAFQAEVEELRAAGLNPLTAEQAASIGSYHDQLLTRLGAMYDVDRSAAAGQLSRGMQLASFFAAVALTAAIYSLVSRFWGRLDLPLQATLLCAFPLMALVGVELSARRERTLYVSALFALVAYGTFWLAAGVLSETLNVPLTPHPIWAGALFGLALALAYGFRLILGIALASLIVATAGSVFQAAGYPWTGQFEHLDIVALTAFAATLLAPRLAELDRTFGAITRGVGLAIGLGALLVLSTSASMSLLPTSNRATEFFYQASMLVACVSTLVLGIRRRWPEVVHLASGFLTIFLFTRLVDWLWSALPRYVFFLLVAGVAFAWLLLLRRIRTRLTRFDSSPPRSAGGFARPAPSRSGVRIDDGLGLVPTTLVGRPLPAAARRSIGMMRIALPALTTMIVVAAFVAVAGWNRSGEPRLVLTLTERELALPWTSEMAPGDDPGLQLRVEITHRGEPLDARNWLPETRLRALGFPLNIPLGDPTAEESYRDLPARVAWLALEYDGPVWRDIERRAALHAESDRSGRRSRLVPVDAAPDAASLHTKYPTGHLIVRAIIALSYVDARNGGPLVYGWVRAIVPSTVTVPKHLRSVVAGLIHPEVRTERTASQPVEMTPRYEVDLAIGRLGLPYVSGLRRAGGLSQ